LNVFVIGLGEIGRPLYEIVKGVHNAFGVDVDPDRNVDQEPSGPVGVMHICFPYSEEFVEKVVGHIGKFNPNLTIVESTVRPGTTSLIWRLTDGKHHLVHSPGKIEGHCVIPNVMILKEVYPSKFMEALIESTELEH